MKTLAHVSAYQRVKKVLFTCWVGYITLTRVFLFESLGSFAYYSSKVFGRGFLYWNTSCILVGFSYIVIPKPVLWYPSLWSSHTFETCFRIKRERERERERKREVKISILNHRSNGCYGRIQASHNNKSLNWFYHDLESFVVKKLHNYPNNTDKHLVNLSSKQCYKTFFGGKLRFPQNLEIVKVCSDVWACRKMIKQCYFIKTVYFFKKMAYSYCFRLGTDIDFPDFMQKSFITLTTDRNLILLIFSTVDNSLFSQLANSV